MSNEDQPTTLYDLKQLVRTCVEDEAEYLREAAHPEDSLHEIADGCVPVYYSELAQVLVSEPDLGFGPEEIDSPDNDNVWQILQAAIYERLYQEAGRVWNELRGELDLRQKCITCEDITEVDPDVPASRMCLDCFIAHWG